MTDLDRIRAAAERAIASVQAHRDAGPTIMGETAPLYFPSRPDAGMPEYIRPDFAARLLARLQRAGREA